LEPSTKIEVWLELAGGLAADGLLVLVQAVKPNSDAIIKDRQLRPSGFINN
jgi:hypothetical protein